MKMVKNQVIHEVLAKQYLRPILDISAFFNVARCFSKELGTVYRFDIANSKQ